MNPLPAILAATALAGCALPPAAFDPPGRNATLVAGPPVEDVVTVFDEALTCLRGQIRPEIVFAVGQVIDATGKETYTEGGTGKFVTQGAGEMVQSALFRAGVSVVNRRDPNISIVEANWGIRDIKRQVPVSFYVSGSVNSLDFIPGGGFSFQVGGMGPRYRQNRILLALDLTMTDAYTGRVVASVPLQKQIFLREVGASTSRFFGSTLVSFDAGGMEREALHFALRQMISLATFELLGQMMREDGYGPCRERIDGIGGGISNTGTADRAAIEAAMRAARSAPPLAVPVSVPEPAPQAAAAPQPAGPQVARAAPAPVQLTPGAALGRRSVQAATAAIRAARESEAAGTREGAVSKAAESLQLSNHALQLLREAAEAGFNGDEGDVAAVVVQQALLAAQQAGVAAARREADSKREARETPPPAAPRMEETPAPVPDAAAPPPPGGPVQDRLRRTGR